MQQALDINPSGIFDIRSCGRYVRSARYALMRKRDLYHIEPAQQAYRSVFKRYIEFVKQIYRKKVYCSQLQHTFLL